MHEFSDIIAGKENPDRKKEINRTELQWNAIEL